MDDTRADASTIADGRVAATESAPAEPPTPDPRYAMGRVIGRGGMGDVHVARDIRINRDVAIKVLRGGRRDDDAVARFLREAHVQGRLEHPAIVPVHDMGLDADGQPYFVMKRLAGVTLAEVLERGDPRWPKRLLLARLVDVCLAVEFAHTHGVIHRDLKPANVMLGDFGEVHVLDWGLARIADDATGDAVALADLRASADTGGQTVAGALLGTPGYMAPEQMRGEPIDARTDVFALGLILYEIVAGEPAIPRGADAFDATLSATSFRPSRRAADVAPELDDACASATAGDPEARMASARALADRIQAYLDGDRDHARRRELAATKLAAAETALARGAPGRAEATREAGSALALDPDNAAASRMLARLILEPGAAMPPDAQRELDRDRLAVRRSVLRAGAWTYAVYVAVTLGVLPWSRTPGVMLVLVGMLSGLGGFLGYMSRKDVLVTDRVVYLTLAAQGVMMVFAGCVVSPLIVFPPLALGALVISVSIPTINVPRTAFFVHAAGVVVPLALEWTGVTPRTYTIVGDTLVFHSWSLDVSGQAFVVIAVATFLVQAATNVVMSVVLRRGQDDHHAQLHRHQWHFRQVLPLPESSQTAITRADPAPPHPTRTAT